MSYVSKDSSLWFNMPMVAGAWQASGAPGINHTLQNMKNGGVDAFRLTSPAYPAWSAQNGWMFNGSTTYLDTGYIRTAYVKTAFLISIKYTGTLSWRYLFGAKPASGNGIGMTVGTLTSTLYWIGSGGSTAWGPNQHRDMVAGGGYHGRSGDYYEAYVDGVRYEGNRYNENYTFPNMYIGGQNANGVFANGVNAQIKAFCILQCPERSAAIMEVIMHQMRYCDANPEWSVWNRRRQWFYLAATASGVPKHADYYARLRNG